MATANSLGYVGNLRNPVGGGLAMVWWLTILAGLQSLTGATVIMEVLPTYLSGGFVALVGALSQGTAVYVALKRRHPTIPIDDVREE